MSHPEQKQFCEKIKAKFPERFRNKKVLDVGSLDINGNNRYLFENCNYLGFDLGHGLNVDIICPIHKYYGRLFDTIISTEAFEHDANFKKSINNIVNNLLQSNGLFLFTCASLGRKEHGTTKHSPQNSPFTNEYYKNISEEDIKKAIKLDLVFKEYIFETDVNDLYFYGIKK